MADDVLQEAAIHVWEHRAELPGVKNFSAWLFMIARFKVLGSRRDLARRKETMLSDDVFELFDRTALRLLENGREHRLQALESCMMQFRRDDRELLMWRYRDRRRLTELSALLERPADSFHHRVSRGAREFSRGDPVGARRGHGNRVPPPDVREYHMLQEDGSLVFLNRN